MKLPIPDDWDGESWSCVQIQWPDSVLWRIILMGLVSAPTQGRLWDEKSGSIKAAQAAANEAYHRNNPFVDCGDDCPDCDNQVTVITRIICASAEESEGETMAVQKVWIDCETSELVVDYGGCDGECRYSLSCVASDTGPDDPISPDPTGDGPFYACGKAYWAVKTVFQFAESIFTHCDDFLDITPWGEIRDENPGIEYNLAKAYLARAKALEIKGLFAGEWTDVSDLEPAIRCSVLSIFTDTDDDDLAVEGAWEDFKTAFAAGMDWRFWDYFVLVCNALGREQIAQIALDHALDDSQDCACPEAPDPEIPTGFDWYVDYNFIEGLSPDWALTDCERTAEGLHRITVSGQYNSFNWQAIAAETSADSTTKLKYAAIFVDGGAIEWDMNSDVLTINSTPEVQLVAVSALSNGGFYPGGAKKYVWGSSVGEGLEGFGIRSALGGYEWPEGTAKIRITRIVLAGDGTYPFTGT